MFVIIATFAIVVRVFAFVVGVAQPPLNLIYCHIQQFALGKPEKRRDMKQYGVNIGQLVNNVFFVRVCQRSGISVVFRGRY